MKSCQERILNKPLKLWHISKVLVQTDMSQTVDVLIGIEMSGKWIVEE